MTSVAVKENKEIGCVLLRGLWRIVD